MTVKAAPPSFPLKIQSCRITFVDAPLLRRAENRISFKMFVKLSDPATGAFEITSTIDVSCHGARVVTKNLWEANRDLSLQPTEKSSENNILRSSTLVQVPEKKGPVPLGDCLALRQRPKLGDMFGRPDRTKASEFGDRVSLATKPSPLEGPPSYYGQSAAMDLKKLGRREWWLWFSALTVTVLSAAGLLLTQFSRLFRHKDHFYELTPEQARWGILCLLLLFNGWMIYRQRSFRKLRKQATEPAAGAEENGAAADDTATVDSVTGLYTRTSALLHLGREIARAKRHNTA